MCQSICNERENTDWDDITDDEFELLRKYANNFNQKSGYRDNRYMVIVEQVSRPVWQKNLDDHLSKAKDLDRKEKEVALARQKADEKRMATIQAKQLEKKKKQLEKLKAELEGK
jgi:hypothetical protein